MATQRGGPQASQRPQKRLTTTLGSLFVFDTCKASDLKLAMDAMESEAQGDGTSSDFDFDSPFAASSGEASSQVYYAQEDAPVGDTFPEESDVPFATFGTESIFNVFESQSYRASDDFSESGEERDALLSSGMSPDGITSGTLHSRRPSGQSSIPDDHDEFGYADEELDGMIQQLDAAMEEGKEFYPLRTSGGDGLTGGAKPSAFAILASQLADDDTGGNDWLNEEAFFNDFQFAPEWLQLTFSMKPNANGAPQQQTTSHGAVSVGEKGRTNIGRIHLVKLVERCHPSNIFHPI